MNSTHQMHSELGNIRSSAKKARLIRAEWLFSIASGKVTIDQLFDALNGEYGRQLSRLTLRQVMMARPGASRSSVDRQIEKMRSILRTTTPVRRMTLAWLCDPRAGHRRFHAFLDVATAPDGPPWPGFPTTAPPFEPTEGTRTSQRGEL